MNIAYAQTSYLLNVQIRKGIHLDLDTWTVPGQTYLTI